MTNYTTLGEKIEKEVEEIFKNNGHTLTDLRKKWYAEWPGGIMGENIKREVNELIQSYKQEAEKETFDSSFPIGKMVMNEQEIDLNFNIDFHTQISTVNDKYYSLYETSYENIDKHICNPMHCSSSFVTDLVKYTSTDVAMIDDTYVPRSLIEEALKNMEGYPDETVKFYGYFLDKEELEELLRDCDDPEIFEEWTDNDGFSIEDTIDMINNGNVVLDANIPKEQFINYLNTLNEYSGNTKHMTKEQEDFIKKYNKPFTQFQQTMFKENKDLSYHEVVEIFIGDYNKNVNNSEKIDIKSMRPGLTMIKEITPNITSRLISEFTVLKNKTLKQENNQNNKSSLNLNS